MSTALEHDLAEKDGPCAVAGMAESVAATLNVARALVSGCRDVDLQGLDGDIGLLCAHVLDLPPLRGRLLRPKLIALLAELDALNIALETP